MILVTGGAGFIGSVLIKELNKQGRSDIIVVDRLRNSSKWFNLRGAKYYQYINADELFTEDNLFLISKCKLIFHLGACSATTELDMDYLMKNNLEFSKKIFRLATEKNTPIVYASSAATYGDGSQGYSDDHEKIGNFLPLNPYGYSKQLFDEWVLRQPLRPPIWYGLKFFNVFGPNEYHKGHMRSIVHKSFGQINEKGIVQLFKSHRDDFKDGQQLRDFIYVKDVVRAMLEMIKIEDLRVSGIYNMGTGKARSFDDLVKATFHAMGKEPQIQYVDMPQGIRNQYQYFTQAEMKKFYNLLPHFKFMDLEEGIFDYVKNYLQKNNIYYE